MALRCLSKIWRPSWHKHVTGHQTAGGLLVGTSGALRRCAVLGSACSAAGFLQRSLMWCPLGRLWPDPMSSPLWRPLGSNMEPPKTPAQLAELWRFCRSEAARLSELRADRNIAHGELAAAPVSLDAPVAERNDRPLMADVGDQHNGGLSSGKAVLGTAREVDYLKVCHDPAL